MEMMDICLYGLDLSVYYTSDDDGIEVNAIFVGDVEITDIVAANVVERLEEAVESKLASDAEDKHLGYGDYIMGGYND